MKNKKESKPGKTLKDNQKVILAVCLAVLVVVSVYYFVYTPLSNMNKEMQLTLMDVTNNYTVAKNSVAKLESLQTEYNEIAAQNEASAGSYFGIVNQDELIFLLSRLERESGLKINTMGFPRLQTGIATATDFLIAPPTEQTEDGQQQGAEAASQEVTEEADATQQEDSFPTDPVEIDTMLNEDFTLTQISISFSGSYDSLSKMLDLLNEYPKSIRVTSINTANEALGSLVTEEDAVTEEGAPVTGNITGDLVLEIINYKNGSQITPEEDMVRYDGSSWNAGLSNPFEQQDITG